MTTIIDGSGSATFATPLPMAQVADLGLPAYGRVVRTAGSITTTSTSLVDVTGATITLTTGAFPVAYGVAQLFRHSVGSNRVKFNITIDGVLQHGTEGLIPAGPSVASDNGNGSFTGLSAPLSAASHTIKEQWGVFSGTGTILADSANNHLFYAQEIR